MKDYHLTQEQATKLFQPFVKPIKTVVSNAREVIYFVTDEQLREYANAALDQVLGEPVAWAEKGRENNVIADLVKQTNKNEWVKPYTIALYAPKEQS